MPTGDLAANTGCTERDQRVRETDHVNALFHQLLCELSSNLRTAEKDWNNRRIIVAHDVETDRLHSNSEGLGVDAEIFK